jgi:hypothetical protein
MNIKRRKILFILTITTILIATFFIAIYIIAGNSEPYKIATQFIQQNTDIKEQVGQISKTRLAFWGYSAHYRGPHGWAEFEIVVKGAKGQAVVFMNLERDLGEWTVKAARLRFGSRESINLKSSEGNGARLEQ